ncbi:hypothetical protein ABZ935_02830 [Streptomyces coeruleorubidus]|uniref:hypothetical protein n=1 Tax=Streptomyces coeruleorubidus TaxID=116188 RepID=UPI0033FDC673
MNAPSPQPPPPQPPSPWLRPSHRKALALVVSAALSGVVGAWAQDWFADDPDTSGQAVEQPVGEVTASSQPPGTSGALPRAADPDTHCATRAQAVGSVQWVPCARVTDDSVQFGVTVQNSGERQTLRLRLGYIRAQQPAQCGTGNDVSMTVEGGKTTWYTVPECSVARVHAAVQTTAQVAVNEGAFSPAALSPTLHIQSDGSVVAPSPS